MFIAALLAAGLQTTRAQQNNAQGEKLLASAQHKAIVDGDLRGAIEEYKKIVAGAGSNRTLAAQALVHMAECYQKLGDAESQKVYQRVVREYADQTEPASQARARLAALAQSAASDARAVAEKAGVILKELKLDSSHDSSTFIHRLSPDGNKVAYTKRGPNLAVRDLVSGQEKQLTDLKTGTVIYPVWSPDGKKIIYTHWQDYWKYEMHTVSLETGEDQHREINGFARDWSKDGRFILYDDSGVEKPRWTLNLLPVEGGPIRQIMNEDPSKRALDPRLSPDGKSVAYSLPNDRGSNLFLARVDGGEPLRITEGSAVDRAPIWAPDGKMLLFSSNRNLGRWDLFGMRLLDDKPSGEPFTVKPDVGQVKLFDLTENGRLLLARSEGRSYMYVTDIDPETGEAVGEAVRLFKDSAFQSDGGAWSRDGRQILYRIGVNLHVMSADGSNDRELGRVVVDSQRSRGTDYKWAPDNDHIYFSDIRPGSGAGIYSISVSTKEVKPVLLDPEIVVAVDVSPNGKHVAFLKGVQTQGNFHIYIADIDGKNLRQLTFENKAQTIFPAWSPDGKQLAFYKYGAGDRKTSLWVLNVDTGRPTQIFEGMSSEHTFIDPSWSPDGKRIAFMSRDGTGTPNGFELRSMGLTPGDKPKAIRPNLGSAKASMFAGPKWHPGGTKLMFLAVIGIEQVLLMDNFLPKSEAPGKR
jgi:Tol biopolymer transport system component